MVKQLLVYFLLLPAFIFSAEFTASVNRTQVISGENFILNLTLKDASAPKPPDIDILKIFFSISSQQQASSTTFMNGHFSSSTTWKISLTAQHEGEIVIPAISLNTNQGTLTSQPIKINVVKGHAADANSNENMGLNVLAEVSKTKPYKNEAVFYTIKLLSKFDLVNVGMPKFQIDDAVVESYGQPKVYKQIINGIQTNVIEISFIVAPLKPGPLKIPSLTIQGSMPIKKTGPRGGFLDDDFEPFFMLSGFQKLKPFTIATKELILDVQPAIAGILPWLPAKSIALEEFWDDAQPLQVGEPITLGFKITAEGILSNQLPNLQDLLHVDSSFKIYADKPESNDDIIDGNIRSFRKEQFTLIPQQPGSFSLPEISISWWDTVNNKKAIAHIPARTVEILQAQINTSHPKNSETDRAFAPMIDQSVAQRDPLMYGLIAGMAVLLSAVLFWAIALQRKIVKLTEVPATAQTQKTHTPKKPIQPPLPVKTAKPPVKDKKEKLPDLNPT